jgi:hypothetical protein
MLNIIMLNVVAPFVTATHRHPSLKAPKYWTRRKLADSNKHLRVQYYNINYDCKLCILQVLGSNFISYYNKRLVDTTRSGF